MAPGERQDSPLLSVVVATTQPWPELDAVLDSLYEQTLDLEGEIVVAHGHPDSRAPQGRFPRVRWIYVPGASPFRLRSRAALETRGRIIAVTEDHCRVAPDWCESILRAHERYPDADVIGGSIENGASERAIDCANFLATMDVLLPPVDEGGRRYIAGQANTSYKRRVFPLEPSSEEREEGLFKTYMDERGSRAVSTDTVRVAHVQSLGVRPSLWVHFHDGRTQQSRDSDGLSRLQRLLRSPKVLALPLRVALNTPRIFVRTWWRKPDQRAAALRALPWLAPILLFHYSGELVGHFLGAGSSPQKLR